MRLLDYFFRSPHRNSAAVAKERLQIIVAHERRRASAPHYLPLLQRDLLEVVRRYVPIADDQVTVNVQRNGECEVLELNIALPDATAAATPRPAAQASAAGPRAPLIPASGRAAEAALPERPLRPDGAPHPDGATRPAGGEPGQRGGRRRRPHRR